MPRAIPQLRTLVAINSARDQPSGPARHRCYPAALQAMLSPTGSPGRLSDTQKGDNMKFALAAALALIGCLVGFNFASAQGAAMKTTPTTKILAIGTINPEDFEQSQVFCCPTPEEVREYCPPLPRWQRSSSEYSLQGKPGVAFIINVTDPAVAHEMLEKLPLGKAHMMKLRTDPRRSAQPASLFAGHAAETLRYAGPYLDIMRGRLRWLRGSQDAFGP